jgi:cell division inhibitor SepF
MSTLHKVKAYFGMAPMEDYDDEYYEDDDRGTARGYSRRPREARFDDDGGYGRSYEGRDYDEPPAGYRGGYRDEERFDSRLRGSRDFDRPAPRFSALRGSTRGALAMDPRDGLFRRGRPLSRSPRCAPRTTARPAPSVNTRDGTPVIMDLVSMDNADAKRLVDAAVRPSAAWLVRQGRDQGLPAVTGRRQCEGAGASQRLASTPIRRR